MLNFLWRRFIICEGECKCPRWAMATTLHLRHENSSNRVSTPGSQFTSHPASNIPWPAILSTSLATKCSFIPWILPSPMPKSVVFTSYIHDLLYPCPTKSCYISTVKRIPIPTLANRTKAWLLLLFVSFNIGSTYNIFILSFCLNYIMNFAVLLASGTYLGHCHKSYFQTKYWVFSWPLEAGSLV